MRDYESLQEYEEKISKALDTLHLETLEHRKLKDMYVDLESRESLYRQWREDSEVDWVVVDQHLEETADLAETLYEAAGYGDMDL